MKNFKLVKVMISDTCGYTLVSTSDFVEVLAIRVFAEKLISAGSPINTVKLYCQCAARYLDFAVEFASGKYQIEDNRSIYSNSAIHIFFQILSLGGSSSDDGAKNLAVNLRLGPCKRSTVSIYRAALHKFFSLLGKYDGALCSVVVGERARDLSFFPSSLNGKRKISPFEMRQRKLNSVLAGCISGGSLYVESNDFPRYSQGRNGFTYSDGQFAVFEDLHNVLRNIKNIRDKCLFYFIAASGCRVSEALQLLTDDVDVLAREVYIRDPRNRTLLYYQMNISANLVRSLSYKGRSTPQAYLLEPYASLFWQSYQELLRSSVCMPLHDSKGYYIEHRFIFRVMMGGCKGRPLCFSDNYSNITRVLKSAFFESCDDMTPHKIRHSYVSYLCNDAPYKGGTGAGVDVAMGLVGHLSKKSTEKYNRKKNVKDLDEVNKAYSNIIYLECN